MTDRNSTLSQRVPPKVSDMGKSRKRKKRDAEKAAPPTERTRRSIAWHPLPVVVAGVVAYYNSFAGTFVFDDHAHIHASSRIKELWPIWPLLGGRRPTVDITLAVNYAAGRFDVWGYHLVNLLIHLSVALLLLAVIRRTLILAPLRLRYNKSSTWLATIVALLWVVHPLNTQTVTYIIQRGESLMALFYLMTLYFVIRGATARSGLVWLIAAVAACAMGMASKAVMMTAPVAVLLYDRSFLTGSFGAAWKRRWMLYCGLFGTIGVLFACGVLQGVLDPTPHSTSVGLGFRGATPLQYGLTELGVLPYYLRLALWPNPLCFDYAWPFAQTFWEVAPFAAIVVGLLGLTIWAMVRHPRIGFICAWFFLILAPTSSIMPIRDALVEHRMYLPLAAVIVLIVLTGHEIFRLADRVDSRRKRGLPWAAAFIVAATVAGLIVLTARRNTVYASTETLWRDVTSKRPQNARGFLNLGNSTNNMPSAVRALETAIAIDPDYADAYFNLGQAYRNLGRLEDAAAAYRRTAELDADLAASAELNLGLVLGKLGRPDEAAGAYRRCLEVDPANYKAHFNLGNIAAESGNNAVAIERYESCVESAPSFAQARINLARVLMRVGRWEDAGKHLMRALTLVQERARGDVHVRMATVLVEMGRGDEAVSHLEDALRLDPNSAKAKRALAQLRGDAER